MRNLICCGVAGLAVIVTGYAATRYLGPASESSTDHACCVSETCEAHNFASGCPSQPACRPAGDLSSDESEAESSDPAQPTGFVNLSGQSVEAPPTIFIPDGDEPPLALPVDNVKTNDIASVPLQPALMPYCKDDDAPPSTMPYADGDPWPANPANSVQPVGWFEEVSPAHADPMPACREDENLSRQYPGCPSTENTRPADKQDSGRGVPWQHDKEPILPIAPEVPGTSEPPAYFDGDTPEAGNSTPRAEQNWLQSLLALSSGFRRHTVQKFIMDRAGDRPVRQPVDTLEVRPSDLRREEASRDPFE
jgi:hypothetical protein